MLHFLHPSSDTRPNRLGRLTDLSGEPRYLLNQSKPIDRRSTFARGTALGATFGDQSEDSPRQFLSRRTVLACDLGIDQA